MKEKAYIEEKKVVVPDNRFEHVMAITLDPRTDFKEGIIRCITSRSGNLAIKGNTDRSVLHKIKGDSLENFVIGERLDIKDEKEIISRLVGEGDFLGLEDPDIWIDEEAGLMHVYFTIPFRSSDKNSKTKVNLGHAVGKNLDSLTMTEPTLLATDTCSAKEVSIAPLNKQGFRYNLIESRDRHPGGRYSIIQVAIARDMGGIWEYGEIAFHPADYDLPWIAGHASPGPLFSKNFIDVGESKLLGVINGCEADTKVGEDTVYGDFSVGLFIYDYEKGKIDWVSPEPFIQDSEAGKNGGRAITFASQDRKSVV